MKKCEIGDVGFAINGVYQAMTEKQRERLLVRAWLKASIEPYELLYLGKSGFRKLTWNEVNWNTGGLNKFSVSQLDSFMQGSGGLE